MSFIGYIIKQSNKNYIKIIRCLHLCEQNIFLGGSVYGGSIISKSKLINIFLIQLKFNTTLF